MLPFAPQTAFNVPWADHKDNKLPDAAKQEAIVERGSRTMTQADARHLGCVDSHTLSCLLAEQHHLTTTEKHTQQATHFQLQAGHNC